MRRNPFPIDTDLPASQQLIEMTLWDILETPEQIIVNALIVPRLINILLNNRYLRIVITDVFVYMIFSQSDKQIANDDNGFTYFFLHFFL